jgi:hypothetical protein
MRSLWLMLLAIVGLGAVFFAPVFSPNSPGETWTSSPTWIVISLTVAYVIALAAILDYVVQYRRDRVVRSILVAAKVDLQWDGSPDESHRWALHSQVAGQKELKKSMKAAVKGDKLQRKKLAKDSAAVAVAAAEAGTTAAPAGAAAAAAPTA